MFNGITTDSITGANDGNILMASNLVLQDYPGTINSVVSANQGLQAKNGSVYYNGEQLATATGSTQNIQVDTIVPFTPNIGVVDINSNLNVLNIAAFTSSNVSLSKSLIFDTPDSNIGYVDTLYVRGTGVTITDDTVTPKVTLLSSVDDSVAEFQTTGDTVDATRIHTVGETRITRSSVFDTSGGGATMNLALRSAGVDATTGSDPLVNIISIKTDPLTGNSVSIGSINDDAVKVGINGGTYGSNTFQVGTVLGVNSSNVEIGAGSHIHFDSGVKLMSTAGITKQSVEIGHVVAPSTGNQSISIGVGSAAKAQSVAIGYGTNTMNAHALSTSVGYNAGSENQDQNATAVGSTAGSKYQGELATAIGKSAGYSYQGVASVAVGASAGYLSQKSGSVAIGETSGFDSQDVNSVAIGKCSGKSNQGKESVAIGLCAGENIQSSFAIAIGRQAGFSNQGAETVAVGLSAGFVGQGSQCVAMGHESGYSNQRDRSIAIGSQSAYENQGSQSIAIGYYASRKDQGERSVSIGTKAGTITQGDNSTAIGSNAASINQGDLSTAIGSNAASTNQGTESTAIGYEAGRTSQKNQSLAIGYKSGLLEQNTQSLAIGFEAGYDTQNSQSTAIGYRAGYCYQSSGALAIGNQAGFTSQCHNSIAIGNEAGKTLQSTDSISIGVRSGMVSQGSLAIAIGSNAGMTSQQTLAAAIGPEAGTLNQGTNSTAIGFSAGKTNQGRDSLAIGATAGTDTQGDNSTAIGASAGLTKQGAASIAIGPGAGKSSQKTQATAIGFSAGQISQGSGALAIGASAGFTGQSVNTVAIGANAGRTQQKAEAVAIGSSAGATSQGTRAVSLGFRAGTGTQGDRALAIGFESGSSLQGEDATAIGLSAGQTSQGRGATAIGVNAGKTSQGVESTALGSNAGATSQGLQAVAIGSNAATFNQMQQAVAIGVKAGESNQGEQAVAIGFESGALNQNDTALAIGFGAGKTGQNTSSLAIGYQSGFNTQNSFAASIGFQAGFEYQCENALAIGFKSGHTSQGVASMAIGYNAGYSNQGENASAIGANAGFQSQNAFATAIGFDAGKSFQNTASLAIGYQTGFNLQGFNATAIGYQAGYESQKNSATAIGYQSGFENQGVNAVSIGAEAGLSNQGDGAIAIGTGAGKIGQGASSVNISTSGLDTVYEGSIVLNATASGITSTTAGLYAAPVAVATGTIPAGAKYLAYDNITKEIFGIDELSFPDGQKLVIGDATDYTFTGGSLHLVENVGSPASYNTATLMIDHKDSTGSSSIVFRSAAASTNGAQTDYGYIQFTDGTAPVDDDRVFEIGIGGDSTGTGAVDRIGIFTPGTVYTDPRVETMSFQNGKVGIRGLPESVYSSSAVLDVHGTGHFRGTITGGEDNGNGNFHIDCAGPIGSGAICLNSAAGSGTGGVSVGDGSGSGFGFFRCGTQRIIGDSLDSVSTDPSTAGYAPLEITSTTNTAGGSKVNLQIGADHRPGPWGCGFMQGIVDNLYVSPICLQPKGGNVGIGTTTPLAKLDIETTGSGALGYAFRISGTNTFNGDTIVTTMNPGYIRNTVTWTITNAAQYHVFDGAGGLERMRIDWTGNVGIGIASPDQKLHVDGHILTQRNGYIGGQGTSTAATSSLYYAGFGVHGTRCAILPAKNVNGAFSLNDNLVDLGNATNRFLSVFATSINAGSSTLLLNSDSGIQLTSFTGANGSRFGLYDNYAYLDANSVLFRSDASSPAAYAAFTGGKLGIGTVSPYAKLHVVDTVNHDPTDTASISSYQFMLESSSGGSAGKEVGMGFILFDGTPGATSIPGASITHERTGGSSKGKLHFKTKTTETTTGACDTHMTISDNGNVGIGTTAPQSKLHIVGDSVDADAGNPSASSYAQLEITSATNNTGNTGKINLQVGADHNDALGYGFLQTIVDNIHTASLRLQPYGGNVGIGNINPTQRLDVNGSIKGNTYLRDGANRQVLQLNGDPDWYRAFESPATRGVAIYNGLSIGAGGGFICGEFGNPNALGLGNGLFTGNLETDSLRTAYSTNGLYFIDAGNNGGNEPVIKPSTDNYGYLGTTTNRFFAGYITNLTTSILSTTVLNAGTLTPKYSSTGVKISSTTLSGTDGGGNRLYKCFYHSTGSLDWITGVLGGTDDSHFDGQDPNSSGAYFIMPAVNTIGGAGGIEYTHGFYFANDTGFDYWNFTGQHRCKPVNNAIISKDREGYIVKSSGKYKETNNKSGNNIHNISISESLPIVDITNKRDDKAVLGVISMVDDMGKKNTRDDRNGPVGIFESKDNGDDRVYVNSIGEGAVWVSDMNGPIENGDYITTSDIPGVGMKQESAHMMNYTVAKITMDCDFTCVLEPKRIAQSTKNVVKERKKRMEKKEVENTEIQDVYDEDLDRWVRKPVTTTSTVSVQVKETIVLYGDDGEIIDPEFEIDVYDTIEKTEETVHVDENGDVIYEETDEMVAPYKMKYVQLDGTIITETEYTSAKALDEQVYRMAFVGCTYHCG
jgi:hypothetical protein